MKVIIKYRSMSTSAGRVRNGDIVDLPEDELKRISVTKPNAYEIIEEAKPAKKPEPKKAPKKATAKKKRARNKDGTLKADDPSTPDVNEAWENG